MQVYSDTITVEWPLPRQLTTEEEAELVAIIVEMIDDNAILSAEFVSDDE
jgi:hypothetical protein